MSEYQTSVSEPQSGEITLPSSVAEPLNTSAPNKPAGLSDTDTDHSRESENSVDDDDVTITLAPSLTLGNFDSLHAQLLSHLGQPLHLSGAQVERIDTAVLQLLLAFMQSASDKVTWLAPSPKLCTAAHLLGLSSHLNLPAVKTKANR